MRISVVSSFLLISFPFFYQFCYCVQKFHCLFCTQDTCCWYILIHISSIYKYFIVYTWYSLPLATRYVCVCVWLACSLLIEHWASCIVYTLQQMWCIFTDVAMYIFRWNVKVALFMLPLLLLLTADAQI